MTPKGTRRDGTSKGGSTKGGNVRQLGPRQKKILEFLLSEIEDRGYPPSVREIADAVDLKSPSTVHAHLEALQKKGYISKNPTKPRAIEIHYAPDVGPVTRRSAVRHVPLVGRIAAGSPTQALEEVEDVLPLPAEFVGEGSHFMLRVKGDSMIGIGIHDGDSVVVRKQDHADPGDVVAALLDDEATVKTFAKDGARTYLRPENPDLDPIEITPETRILGKVVTLLRAL